MSSEQQFFKFRLTLVFLLFLLLGGALGVRSFQIQVLSDPRLELLSKRQFQSKMLVRPRRGMILDRNGETLALSVEVQSLAANPSKITKKRTLSRYLAKITGQPVAKITERLNEKKEFVWIKRQLKESEVVKLKRLQADGLLFIQENQRLYPQGELAAHLLGAVNIDSEGIEGVELLENARLQGKGVSVNAVKDALGRPTFFDSQTAKTLREGDPVQLTIDSPLQFAAEHELKMAVAKTHSHSGSVIVMDAESGEILALANEPTFNPNSRGASLEQRRNRVVTDGYEPGSTFKAVLLAAALTKGWKLSDRLFGEKGSIEIQGHTISEAEAHEKFEWLSLRDMIKLSSNVVAAKLALRLGPVDFYEQIRKMGFGEKTGLGFPGEIAGKISPPDQWKQINTATIGFGHGVLVTPLQVVRAYAAFANGGWLVTPQIFKSGTGLLPESRRVVSDKVSQAVTRSLESVLEDKGTGTKAALPGYRVAGKTGTSQRVDPQTGKYSKNSFVASFVGYPIGVRPNVVIYTSLVDPQGVYYASETAAPLFKNILEATVNRYAMPSTAPRVLAVASPSSPAVIKDRIQIGAAHPEPLELHSRSAEGKSQWKIPSFKGLTAGEVIEQLQGHRFQLEMLGEGVVREQVPVAGNLLHEGGKIKLVLDAP